MNCALLFGITGMLLFSIGFFGLAFYAGMLRKALALNIMSSGVFLFLISAAYRGEDLAPDPVPHALVLTGIVVSISGTAFMLTVIYCIFAATGKNTLDESEERDKEVS